MSRQTSFEIEDAEEFLNELQEFQKSLEQEWCEVLNQWENLRATWQDDQYYKFETLFEELSATYKRAEEDFKKNLAFVSRQIRITELLTDHRQTFFSSVKSIFAKTKAAVSIVTSVIGMVASSPVPVSPQNQTQASIQAFKEVYTPIAEYDKLRRKQREKEAENSAIADNQTTISGSPPDSKA
jgi:rRNA processing protein Gar1